MVRLKKGNLILLLIIALVVGACSSGAGIAVWSKATNQRMISTEDYKEYKKVTEDYKKLFALRSMIEKNYYKDVDEEALKEGMYRGLFSGLGDPYSYYMDESEYESLKINTDGELSGIGVTVSANYNGYIYVVAPLEGSPADKAGIRGGDCIIKVDGISYVGSQLDEAVQKMRGIPGSEVTITVVRNGKEKEYTLKRENIVMETVKSEMLRDGIGYIRIASFEKNTAADFQKAFQSIQKDGAEGLVIDLRNNPGGLVDSAVEIANMLMPAGIVAYTQDRQGEKQYYSTKGNGTKLPYVVLINEGSASASEILAGGIQDNGSGVLVGTKSFGKGIIQSVTPLNDGSGGAVKLTVLQYFSPKGNVIHEVGITPDYVVELPKDTDFSDLTHDTDPQLKKAISLLKKK